MDERALLIEQLFLKTKNDLPLTRFRVISDWLFDAHSIFELKQETLGIALRLLNTFLAQQEVQEKELLLVSAACLLLAAQVNEIYAPEARDLVYIAGNAFTLEELAQMQIRVVYVLDGQLRPLTALDILNSRMYETVSIKDDPTYTHGKNIALLLYMSYPKYFLLSAQTMANLCQDVVQFLFTGIYKDDSVIEVLYDFSNARNTENMEKYMANTLHLVNAAGRPRFDAKAQEYSLPRCEESDYIAEGSFGTVHKVKCDGRLLAVKKQSYEQNALNELSILSTYKHRNIIAVEHTFVSAEGIDLYMQLGESLQQLLYFVEDKEQDWDTVYMEGKVDSSSLLPLKERRSYILDMARGLKYLHKHGIIHRDLKPQNIIIVQGVAKIADFGESLQGVLSRMDKTPKQASVINLPYRPPELLYDKKKSDYSFQVDIWSLAAIILEVETGIPAFVGFSEGEVLESITSILGTLPTKYYPTAPYRAESAGLAAIKDEFLRNILMVMLDYRPQKRITAASAYERLASHL